MAFMKKKRRKKLIKNLLTLITLITNLFIMSGVTRHWHNLPEQNNGRESKTLETDNNR